MKMIPTAIPDVLLVEPDVHGDARGFFAETFRQSWFDEQGATFVQDNLSRSSQGVLRGLHYQLGVPQGKLVRVMAGEVFDVAVDLRQRSPTFGKWVGETLSAQNHRMLWVPEGFAHGFLVTSATADVFYKCTSYYTPDAERSIAWNDPDIGIEWPLAGAPSLSERDSRASTFATAPYFD